jgi:hypothetical protein
VHEVALLKISTMHMVKPKLVSWDKMTQIDDKYKWGEYLGRVNLTNKNMLNDNRP